MSRVFVISDTHFGHHNIIGYENRPFKDVEEMDNFMIEEWNKVVTKGDKIFHLGDFSFGYNKEQTKKILSQLRGRKHLIMGNHDRRRSRTWWLDAGFDQVTEYPVLYEGFWILSHEPVYMNQHMPYINVHGHIHGQKYDSGQFYNVCVEHLNYRPIKFDEIKASYKEAE